MTGFAAEALQDAIFAALQGDANLMQVVEEIWDEPDEDAPFPYVSIGDSTVVDNGTKTENGTEHTLTLHTWSQAAGRSETKQIMGLVYAALHEKDLSLVGDRLINLRFEFGDDFRDPDGRTYRGVMRFRAVIEEA